MTRRNTLFSNGIFLENGKSWVFTYHKNTFKFGDSELEILNKLIEKPNKKEDEKISHKNDDLDIQVSLEMKKGEKFAIINSNKNIFETKDYEIIFHLMDKTNNKANILRTRNKTTKIGITQDILRYEVVKILFSSDKVSVK